MREDDDFLAPFGYLEFERVQFLDVKFEERVEAPALFFDAGAQFLDLGDEAVENFPGLAERGAVFGGGNFQAERGRRAAGFPSSLASGQTLACCLHGGNSSTSLVSHG